MPPDDHEKPLDPIEATDRIRSAARSPHRLTWVDQVTSKMGSLGLWMGDLLHVLRVGCVLQPGQPSTHPGLFKYVVEGKSPNSRDKTLKIVAMLSTGNWVKICDIQDCLEEKLGPAAAD